MTSLLEGPTSCCDLNDTHLPDHPPTTQLSCFVPAENGDQGHCIDPVSILTYSKHPRCFFALDCNNHGPVEKSKDNLMECVRPDGSARLLRIVVAPPISRAIRDRSQDEPKETIVLWSGPREEVFEQGLSALLSHFEIADVECPPVKVGTLAPRYAVLPIWLPNTVELFFEYVNFFS